MGLADYRALLLWEPVEKFFDQNLTVWRERLSQSRVTVDDLGGQFVLSGGVRLNTAEQIQGPAARQNNQPCNQRSSDGIEALGTTPDSQENILCPLLRLRPLAKHPEGRGEDFAGIFLHHRCQSRLVVIFQAS